MKEAQNVNVLKTFEKDPADAKRAQELILSNFTKKFEREFSELSLEKPDEIPKDKLATLLLRFGMITTIEPAAEDRKINELWQIISEGNENASKQKLFNTLCAILLIQYEGANEQKDAKFHKQFYSYYLNYSFANKGIKTNKEAPITVECTFMPQLAPRTEELSHSRNLKKMSPNCIFSNHDD